METLKNAFEVESYLKFTHKANARKLPFLDVSVEPIDNILSTSVYGKDTNKEFCMNGAGECPERYKRRVLNAYVNGAFTHCSSWRLVLEELERLTKVLANSKACCLF